MERRFRDFVEDLAPSGPVTQQRQNFAGIQSLVFMISVADVSRYTPIG